MEKKYLRFTTGKSSGTKSLAVLETGEVVMGCLWMLLLQSAALQKCFQGTAPQVSGQGVH